MSEKDDIYTSREVTVKYSNYSIKLKMVPISGMAAYLKKIKVKFSLQEVFYPCAKTVENKLVVITKFNFKKFLLAPLGSHVLYIKLKEEAERDQSKYISFQDKKPVKFAFFPDTLEDIDDSGVKEPRLSPEKKAEVGNSYQNPYFALPPTEAQPKEQSTIDQLPIGQTEEELIADIPDQSYVPETNWKPFSELQRTDDLSTGSYQSSKRPQTSFSFQLDTYKPSPERRPVEPFFDRTRLSNSKHGIAPIHKEILGNIIETKDFSSLPTTTNNYDVTSYQPTKQFEATVGNKSYSPFSPNSLQPSTVATSNRDHTTSNSSNSNLQVVKNVEKVTTFSTSRLEQLQPTTSQNNHTTVEQRGSPASHFHPSSLIPTRIFNHSTSTDSPPRHHYPSSSPVPGNNYPDPSPPHQAPHSFPHHAAASYITELCQQFQAVLNSTSSPTILLSDLLVDQVLIGVPVDLTTLAQTLQRSSLSSSQPDFTKF